MSLASFAGCAFVTYTNRTSALAAIKDMHHSTTMEVVFQFLFRALSVYHYVLRTCCSAFLPPLQSSAFDRDLRLYVDLISHPLWRRTLLVGAATALNVRSVWVCMFAFRLRSGLSLLILLFRRFRACQLVRGGHRVYIA